MTQYEGEGGRDEAKQRVRNGIAMLRSSEITPVCLYKGQSCQAVSNCIFELALVIVTAVWLMNSLKGIFIGWGSWLSLPAVLVGAALFPTIIRGEKFGPISLNPDKIGYSLKLLGITCLVVFPTALGSLLLLQFLGMSLPLIPMIENGSWINWILYQFMYIAVAEEIFFRRYVLGNLLQLETNLSTRCPRLWQGITIVISAAVFALAHVILLENILSVLTFFPALALGWLFVRTRSLLAPILFHGLANTFYAITAMILL